ncbi:MAG: DUF1016 domain-containing protein [Gammaproteobacteria bacterium]|nr:DUF1016 domain-containing protein [Gammaproteobacteria bacterium]
MSKISEAALTPKPDALFGRVVTILEQARGSVVRAVNSNMVLAYWLIGREIVEELQGGEGRAEYGKQILEALSVGLTERYGKGLSVPNLRNFRKFYLAYSTRGASVARKQYPMGTESRLAIPRPSGVESLGSAILHPIGGELVPSVKSHPAGIESSQGFSPHLTWSHYRALMRVGNMAARDFYEREAGECGWSKTQLERQIHSFYYERIVANCGEKGLLPDGRERLPGERVEPTHLLKSPMVLEFLGLPDSPELHESSLEQAIIDNLQHFILELGKGFAFVARQKHIRFGDDDF